MILYIIAIVLLLVGILFIILGVKEVFYDSEPSFVSGVALTIFDSVFILVLLGLTIGENNNYSKTIKRTEIQETINSLNNTRKALEYKIDSNTVTILEVNSYNESVKEFKTEIKKGQINANNPWVNWVCSPVYNEFSVEDVSYLYL